MVRGTNIEYSFRNPTHLKTSLLGLLHYLPPLSLSLNLEIWILGYPNGSLAKFRQILKLKSSQSAMSTLYDGESGADQRIFIRNTEIG